MSSDIKVPYPLPNDTLLKEVPAIAFSSMLYNVKICKGWRTVPLLFMTEWKAASSTRRFVVIQGHKPSLMSGVLKTIPHGIFQS
jgi:hypothetical protein